MRLTLPLPPSMNAYWRSIARGNHVRVLLSREARNFKEQCRAAALIQATEVIEGDVILEAAFFFKDRRRDLDNAIKPLLDALEGLCYGNDRQIVRLVVSREIDPQRPRVEVDVVSSSVSLFEASI